MQVQRVNGPHLRRLLFFFRNNHELCFYRNQRVDHQIVGDAVEAPFRTIECRWGLAGYYRGSHLLVVSAPRRNIDLKPTEGDEVDVLAQQTDKARIDRKSLD